MTMPSPFELGRSVGENISGGIRGAQERGAIDEILAQANASEDPQAVNNAIGQILRRVSPEKQEAALQILGQKQQQLQRQRQMSAYEEQGLGGNFGSLPENIQKELIKTKGQKQIPDQFGTLSAIDELEKLAGKTGIGLAAQLNQSEEARYNRGRFQSLQAKLLPLFKGMFPRGMTEKEFKFIQANYIPQPGDTEAKIKGKLQGLRELVGEQMPSSAGSSPENTQMVKMKDPFGVIRNIPADQVEAAQAAGGTLIQ